MHLAKTLHLLKTGKMKGFCKEMMSYLGEINILF